MRIVTRRSPTRCFSALPLYLLSPSRSSLSMGIAKRISKAETSSNNKRSRKSTICNSQKKISFFFERKNNESSADQQAGSYLNDVTNSQEDELNDKVTEKHRENSGGNDGQDNGIGLTEDKKGQASISNDVINRENGTAASLSNETTFATSMYTDEFNTMLSTVLDGEDHLFSKDEIRIFSVYKALSVEAQHLFVRLWMRKQRWHRLEKLDYHRHVSDIHASTDELCDNGLVTTTLESIEDALALLTIEELKLLAEEQQITVELKKNRMDYVNALKAPARNGWRRTVFDYVGHCVMIKENIHAIFARLHLVYYRLNDPTSAENPMSSAILARINRRNYPEYVTMRSTSIWMSRQELLAYEKAYNVYQAFEDKVAKALATGRESKENLLKECWMLAENYIGVWEEQINHAREEAIDRPYYLRRFEAGWMYTHMLEHGTQILARLQEYTLESIILRKLLDQSLYRLGKRGEWYNRLALVQSLHLKSLPERERKKKALATCIEAIQDPRVHQIYLNRLQWRIQKLERDLAVPRREQHDFSYMILKKPQENVIYGERISDATIGYKSVWRSDDGAECSVEQLAIQYYKKKGYKGLHTESGVVSMLFMLLMWDVIFAPMPGVFETPYQSAPMDLWTDAFYVGRAGMINDRLSDIGRGKHLEIIKQTDERERARETFCAGVQWHYKREDLLEIAECIGPCALSSLCKLLAEEFGHRRGGMPDLCCWNYEEKKCLFVEVKGPGDRLSETQKLWIDTLAAFGVPAEVCHVKVWQADDVLLNDGEDL